MSVDDGRLALLTEEHLEVLLTKAAMRAAKQVVELSQPERGLKVSEVADRLSCAESTVYGLVERGALPAVRLGSAIRVLESALNDWIRAQARAW
jgi:excisionase family DNA binding protein